MNIAAYLSYKYDVNRATTLTKVEAKILAIPWPLRKGWMDLHGNREITADMAVRLRGANEDRMIPAEYMSKAPNALKWDQELNDLCRAGIAAANIAEKQAKWEPQQINPASDAFLNSYEWKRVRLQAIKKYGPRCQCCGADPKTARLVVDHIKPRKLFPSLALDVDNLQVLCDECNRGKGNWDMTDWRSDEKIMGM